ncbi:MAG TPA: radical SAM/SPASM domain-containing protein [Candidatus Ozemobacteraceae bacterium]
MRTKTNSVSNPYYTYGMLYKSENFKNWEATKGEKFKNYRQAWTERVRNQDYGQFPLNLNTEITTRCNLKCSFCTHLSLKPHQIGDITFDQFKRLIDEGERFGLPTININGLGEPLLCKELPRFIRYAKEHGVLDVMFHTNGTLMTEEIAEELIDAGLDRIVFSVDSPDKKTYETMRILDVPTPVGKESAPPKGFPWEKLVANVLKFVEVRNRRGLKAPIIRATMVATEKTVHQVPDLLKLWKPHVDHITVQDLTWRTKILDQGFWTNKENSALSANFDAIREEAVKRNIHFVCPYLFQSVYQFYGGNLIPCGNPNARSHMIMGRWDEQSIHEIWTGKAYSELRALHTSGKWYEHPICKDCDVALLELFKDMISKKIAIDWHAGEVDDSLAIMGEQLESIYLDEKGAK